MRWEGIGCDTCHLKRQCTTADRRLLSLRLPFRRAQERMHERMSRPEAKGLYAKRMATIEPVFAFLESVMGFRRAATRLRESVLAEVSLNILAYNIARLIARNPVTCILLAFEPANEF